jgi:hypothetical protein
MNSLRSLDRRLPRLAVGLATLAILVSTAAWIAPPALGGGCGHDPRLDEADQALQKAYELINAAQNPGVDPPFGNHDQAALRLITAARNQVSLAIVFAESSCD